MHILKILSISVLSFAPLTEIYSQFNYYPPKPKEVSESAYKNGKLILENSYGQIKNASNGVVAIDYWNVAVAYFQMGQSGDTIYNLLLNAKIKDEESFCSLAQIDGKRKNGIEHTQFYKLLGNSYQYLIEGCERFDQKKTTSDPILYAKENGYDIDLITELEKIGQLDQKYRLPSYNPILQKPIDAQNIIRIEAIIEKYGYPGNKLVGNKYESIAWIVIQHAELSYQEKLLPIIHETVLCGELPKAPLQMLIDRIYVKKTNVQIFGSQYGAGFADEKTINEVKKKYDLE
jgi:hypothetical protein